jgi:hypothetical protein
MMMVKVDSLGFNCAWLVRETPFDKEAGLAQINKVRKEIPGTLLEEKEITIQGYTGRDFSVQSGTECVRIRVVVAGKMVVVLTLVDVHVDGLRSKDAIMFIESLTIRGDIKKPDDKTGDGLGDAAVVGDYVINPPKDYTVPKIIPPPPPPPPGINSTTWAGAQRPDGSAAKFTVLVAAAPPAEKVPSSMNDEMLNGMLKSFSDQRHLEAWKQSAFEKEKIGGLTFQQVNWSGKDSKFNKNMHGFMYAAVDGRMVITITCEDAEPHQAATLKLAQQAARSFRKKQAGKDDKKPDGGKTSRAGLRTEPWQEFSAYRRARSGHGLLELHKLGPFEISLKSLGNTSLMV